MAATVLSNPRAVEMSIYVVRAFVRLREVLASNREFVRKLEVLEKSVATLDARTRRQFEEVYAAIRALMRPPGLAFSQHQPAYRCWDVRHFPTAYACSSEMHQRTQ